MIAVDTNLLVRLVIRDDEAQARAAEQVMLKARRSGESVYVADAVLCGFVWALRARYQVARTDCVRALEELLEVELLEFSDQSAVERSLSAWRAGRGDFADYLIRERALAAGATEVVTFDRTLAGEPGFRVVGARRRG